jgi:hypothetical protein
MLYVHIRHHSRAKWYGLIYFVNSTTLHTPWRDSISRPIAPVSPVVGGGDTKFYRILFAQMSTYVCTYICMYICMYIHMYVHLYVHLYVQCSQKQNKSLAYVEYRANVTAEVGLSGLNVCQILNIYYSMKRLPKFMSNSQHFSKKMKS